MKKTLAAILALVILSSAALVACEKKNNNNNENNNNDTEDDIFVSNNGTNTNDTSDTNSDSSNTTKTDDFVALTASKTVYVMSDVYLRNEPSKNSSQKKVVTTGTELTATAKNDKWYKVTYSGETLYVVVDYVTDNKNDTVFNAISADEPLKELTLVKNSDGTNPQVNLREVPVVHSDVSIKTIGRTAADVADNKPEPSKLQIVAKNESGTWYKVKYDNVEYYLAINTTTKPFFVELKGGNSGPVGG